jgi:pyruvate-formate lyase
MKMVSVDTQVSELNYLIRKKQTELEHLDKYLKHRQKTGLVSDYDEKDVSQQRSKILAEIEDMNRRIYRLENEQVRKQNLR